MYKITDLIDVHIKKLLRIIRYLIIILVILSFSLFTYINKAYTGIRTNSDDIAYVQTLAKTNNNTKEVLRKHFKNYTKIPQEQQKITIAEYKDINIVKYDQTTEYVRIKDIESIDLEYIGFKDNIAKNYLNTPLDEIVLVFYNKDNVFTRPK